MSITTLSLFRSLRVVNYRIWAAGALVSNIGTWMQRAAQDWLVLTQLTAHNAQAVGIVMGLQFGPQILLLPWTGYAADHFDQRRLLMLTQTIMGGLALLLGVLTVSGEITLTQVYVLAFLFGCAAAFDAPARQTFVGELVDQTNLSNAVALNSTSFNAGRMIGPAVAGLLIASIGTGWAFVLNGLSFFAVVTSLRWMRLHQLYPKARAGQAKGSFVQGLAYVWGRADLRAMLIMLFLIGTFGLNFPIFISTMAVRVFQTDARGFGLLSSCMAAGTIAGSLLAASRSTPGFRTLLSGVMIFGVGCIMAAVAPGYWSFAGSLVVIGIAALTFATATNSVMQLSAEPAMRGRVMAIRIAVALGCTPIGSPFVGWVADSFGPRWSLAVGAASGFAAAGVALLYMIRVPRSVR